MGLLPSEIQNLGWSGSSVDVEIQEQFEAADLLAYKNTATDNMTYPYSSLDDAPSPPQWETSQSGKYLEVIWFEDPNPYFTMHIISLRDVQMEWWGRDYHALTLKNRQGQPISSYGYSGSVANTEISKAVLVANFEAAFNATYFSGRCEHLMTNILISYNWSEYASIGVAFDAGKLGYSLTYDVDYNATGLNGWNIAASLLSFQAPDIGIGGVGGIIINACVAIPIWALVAYIVFKLIAGIIPFISGGSGD